MLDFFFMEKVVRCCPGRSWCYFLCECSSSIWMWHFWHLNMAWDDNGNSRLMNGQTILKISSNLGDPVIL